MLRQGLIYMLVNDNQKLHRIYDRLMELLYKLTDALIVTTLNILLYMNRQEYERVLKCWDFGKTHRMTTVHII